MVDRLVGPPVEARSAVRFARGGNRSPEAASLAASSAISLTFSPEVVACRTISGHSAATAAAPSSRRHHARIENRRQRKPGRGNGQWRIRGGIGTIRRPHDDRSSRASSTTQQTDLSHRATNAGRGRRAMTVLGGTRLAERENPAYRFELGYEDIPLCTRNATRLGPPPLRRRGRVSASVGSLRE